MRQTQLELFRPGRAVLLVIDKQNAYMDSPLLKLRNKSLPESFDMVINNLDKFIITARKNDIPVVWTQMTEDIDLSPPAISAKMKFDLDETGGRQIESKPGSFDYQIFGNVTPDENELVIAKDHYDAFSNPKLIQYLKKNSLDSVMLAGGFTSRCVLSTAVGANNNDVNVLILEDLVISPVEFEHEISAVYSIVNGILGYVSNSEELQSSWVG